jgi:type VI secretion system secreted protein VgrG
VHTFKVKGLDHELRVVRFNGYEGMSELFAFEVALACAEHDLAFDDIVGKPATLDIRSGDSVRHVHGIVSDFEQGEEGKKLTAYRAVLVPLVWNLKNRRASKIFQNLAVPEIVKKVLDNAKIAASSYRFALQGSYKSREYCVQYRETDWGFVCRLLEEEGIAHFFDHTEDGHVLVFADSSAAYGAIAGKDTIVFRTSAGALLSDEHINQFHYSQRVRPEKVTLRDYNFKKPSLLLEGQAEKKPDLEIYDYPGDYDDPSEGTRLAKLRLEELRASTQTAEGLAVCPRLLPGFTFKMADHPRDDFNQTYLVTRVEHHGLGPDSGLEDEKVYEARFQVIPGGVPFRPALITPKPTIRGVQTAIVTGPGSDEICTDEYGRVKVHFHWDREGQTDDTSSCWIRVSQISAGSSWGAVFLPRVGHEVVVDFIEGDPDRPLVVGSVYHAVNKPPYSLPADKTKSTIKTNSSTGGGGFNEVRFEDKKGSEEFFMHAQKDLNVVVENDQTETVGRNDSLTVTGNLTLEVGGEVTFAAGGGGSSKENPTKGTLSGDVTLELKKNMTLTVDKDWTETIKGAASETVNKSKSVSVDENYTLKVTKDGTIKIDKNLKEEVGEKMSLVVGSELKVEVGDAKLTLSKSGDITVEGKKITVKGTGPVEVQGSKLQLKSDGDVSVQAGGNVQLKGSQVGVN